MNKKDIIKFVIKPIENQGFRAWFVGGCVRDSLMNKAPHDFDICTDATPEQLHKIFHNFSEQNSEPFGVTMPIVNGELIEIATLRKDITKGRHPKIEFTDCMQEDAARRDFTINALFEDCEGTIFDPTGFGKEDIKNNKLRFIGSAKERIEEDPLRILRFVRFVCQKGFNPDESNIAEIKNIVESIGTDILFKEVSKERILKEFISTIGGKHFNSDKFDLLNACGLIKLIGLDPFFKDMENTEQSPVWHAEGNVLNHTKLVINEMSKEVQSVEDEHTRFIMMLSAMLHDIGKPESGRINGLNPKTGKPLTADHDIIGAKIAFDFCKSIGMPNIDCKDIEEIVGNHMNMHNLPKMKSKLDIMNILNLRNFDILVKLARSDFNGSIAIKECDDDYLIIDQTLNLPKIKDLIGKQLPKPIITGDFLIKKGFKPSKKFAKALSVAYKVQVNQNETNENTLFSNIKILLK